MAAARYSGQGHRYPARPFLRELVAHVPVGEQDLRVVGAARPGPPLFLCRSQERAARERTVAVPALRALAMRRRRCRGLGPYEDRPRARTRDRVSHGPTPSRRVMSSIRGRCAFAGSYSLVMLRQRAGSARDSPSSRERSFPAPTRACGASAAHCLRSTGVRRSCRSRTAGLLEAAPGPKRMHVFPGGRPQRLVSLAAMPTWRRSLVGEGGRDDPRGWWLSDMTRRSRSA